jgi:ABC-type phosphate/phosphonate transport system substrate-binding protein
MTTAKICTLSLLFIICFYAVLTVSVCPAQTEKPRMNVGYTTSSLPDVDIKDASAALNIWIKEVGEKAGFQTKSILYENAEALIRDFAARKVEIAFLRTLEYLAAGKKIDAEIRQSSTKQGKGTVKYLLLVHSGSKHAQIGDLKGARFAILKNNDLGMMFLNTQFLKARFPEAREFFGEIQEKPKESQVLLSAFFGQADACLVTDTSYKTMAELNPQIGQKLKIIATSTGLTEIVNFMQKDLDEVIKEKIIQASIRLKETERGRQMLILFNTDGVIRASDEKLETAKQLVAEYEKLKRKK